MTSSDPFTDSGGSTVGWVLVLFLLVVGFGVAAYAYDKFKTNGFRPRTVHTRLAPRDVVDAFARTVTGTGWTIVDWGNPVVAQSGLLSGIRQQIALRVEPGPTGCTVQVFVPRYSKKVLGGATKAYTLRWRMSSFLTEVRRMDTNAMVQG
ncbi:hypothetical protein EV383_4802 [Pseudonocardia sediminis]|uniref:Uncharacterized protein n=1 Tax=Pseudonocardia sediminis TaxID=1397368 RepID=A0A4V2FRA5_PSEST|nr:hypothetical protein [Pseudonocardia sediminis]RZT87870.1 hypothetical protein EV383_4802 [Pseudonocardia sediminis]